MISWDSSDTTRRWAHPSASNSNSVPSIIDERGRDGGCACRLAWAGTAQSGKMGFHSLPHARKAAFLDGEIHAVHVTAFGICLHDFAVAPCPYHLNCVRGCADYLRTNGSARERRNLIQIQDATERTLSSARSHAAKENMQIAEPWIRHCEETLAGVKRALAVDDDVNESEPVVRAFPDGRSRFKIRKD